MRLLNIQHLKFTPSIDDVTLKESTPMVRSDITMLVYRPVCRGIAIRRQIELTLQSEISRV